MEEAIKNINKAIGDGGDKWTALADSLVHIAANGDLTSSQFEALALQIGASAEELEIFKQRTLEQARAAGLSGDVMSDLAVAFSDGAHAADIAAHGIGTATEATEDFEEETYDAAAALEEASDKLSTTVDLLGAYFDLIDGRLDGVRKLRDVTEEQAAKQQVVNDLIADGKRDTPEYIDAIDDLSQANQDLRAAQQSLVEQGGLTRGEFIAQQVQMGLNLSDAKLLADQMDDLFKPRTVHNQIINTITNTETGGGGGGGLAPVARQHGGPVRAGHPYLVGEQGPELFVPHSSGQVLNNQVTNQLGGQTINVRAVTTANPNDIASAVAWSMRTAGV
jgi:hypothetical protein